MLPGKFAGQHFLFLYLVTFSAPFSPFTTYTPFGIFLPQNSPYVIVPSCVPTEENTFTTSSAAICVASSVTSPIVLQALRSTVCQSLHFESTLPATAHTRHWYVAPAFRPSNL